MSLSMRSFAKGKIQLKAARVLVGMPGHKPSGFNVKVGKCMKGKSPSNGGRHDTGFQAAFINCAIQAGANVGPAGRAKASKG